MLTVEGQIWREILILEFNDGCWDNYEENLWIYLGWFQLFGKQMDRRMDRWTNEHQLPLGDFAKKHGRDKKLLQGYLRGFKMVIHDEFQ